MSTTRRKFLKASAFGAAFAAIPCGSVFAQQWKDRDANPGEASVGPTDSLALYSKASFSPYINSIFQIHTTRGIVDVTLIQIGDLPAVRNGECLSLLFRGGRAQLGQGTYTMVHAALGTFALLLVPTDKDRSGAQGYVATINRLSYADRLAYPPPSRSLTSLARTSAPLTSPALTEPGPASTRMPPPSDRTMIGSEEGGDVVVNIPSVSRGFKSRRLMLFHNERE